MDISAIKERHSSIQIVPYSSEYKEQAMVIAEEMHQRSVYKDCPLDKEKVIRQLACCGNLVPDRYFKLAVRNGEVLGGFFGHVITTFFSNTTMAHDMGWWVKQSSRGSAAAVLLLADFENWAREQGASKVMVGQSTEVDIERTTKLYKHCGFRVIGYNTVKDL